jgi:hypothetical protein
MMKVKVTLNVEEKEIERFRELASEFGFISGSGRLAGQGNQNQLVAAIASGQVLVVKNPAYSTASPNEG